MMKPLEWLLLAVLNLLEVNPENRITVPYLPEKDHLFYRKKNDQEEEQK